MIPLLGDEGSHAAAIASLGDHDQSADRHLGVALNRLGLEVVLDRVRSLDEGVRVPVFATATNGVNNFTGLRCKWMGWL